MKRLLLALGITVAIMLSPVLLVMGIVIVDSIKSAYEPSYEEKKEGAWLKNRAALEPELLPVCGPSYETTCFLNTALSRLEATQFKDKAAFETLTRISATAVTLGDEKLLERLLAIMQSPAIRKPDANDVRRRTEIMKLIFALGRFDEGMATLNELKGKQATDKYYDIPQIAAMQVLIDRSDLDAANKIAWATKDWPLEFAKYVHMHQYYSNGDRILELIKAYVDEGNGEKAKALLPLLKNVESAYFDSRKYNETISHISAYLGQNDKVDKNPKEWCKKLLTDFEKDKMRFADTLITEFGKMECREEQRIVAQYINDEWTQLEQWDGRRNSFDQAQIVLGKGEKLLQESIKIEDPFERFRSLGSLVRKFYQFGMDDLEQEALHATLNLYKEMQNLSNEAERLHYERNRLIFASDLVTLLKNIGLPVESKEVLNKLIAEADSLDKKALAELLRFNDYPSYPQFEEYEYQEPYVGEHLSREAALKKINSYIQNGNIAEAQNLFGTLYQDGYAASEILPALFATKTEGPFLEKVWKIDMTDCFKTSMVNKLKTRDPSILVAGCLNDLTNNVLRSGQQARPD